MITLEQFKTNYIKYFGEEPKYIFSAPGRSELSGNHTDHQHGLVLAAAINLDIRAAVNTNNTNTINIVSEGFESYSVGLNDLDFKKEELTSSSSLVRGIASRFNQLGKKIGGFNAYIYSDVFAGSGLSSSAAFEILISTILNELNDCKFNQIELAQISQYAENVYFGKPSGLMDQMASSVGNVVNIDFKDTQNPIINKIDFDFDNCGYTLCVINSGADHMDLTQEYADITTELKQVCNFFNKEYLREVDENEFYKNINELRIKVGDRGVLRAIHVFDENKRVIKQVEALNNNKFEEYLKLMNESGESSWKYLQNISVCGSKKNQEVALALALCKKLLDGKGACRVHGGGFGGTIQAFVLNDDINNFKETIEKYFGNNSCHILNIRKQGGMLLKEL